MIPLPSIRAEDTRPEGCHREHPIGSAAHREHPTPHSGQVNQQAESWGPHGKAPGAGTALWGVPSGATTSPSAPVWAAWLILPPPHSKPHRTSHVVCVISRVFAPPYFKPHHILKPPSKHLSPLFPGRGGGGKYLAIIASYHPMHNPT